MKLQKNKKKKSYILFFTTALLFAFLATGCQIKSLQPISDSRFMLDTIVTITLYDSNDQNILNGAFDLCEQYENLLSKTRESSEIYQFNNRKNNEPITVSDETAELLQKGLYYSEVSDGAFDITIAPASELWDFKSENPRLPNAEELKEKVKDIGYKNLHLDGNILTSDDPRTQIDLGAIAKGFIADKLKEYLLEEGVTSAVINLGGNVLCVGNKPDGSNFHIGLQKPFESHSETIETLAIDDLSVVSSGIYERYFKVDGTLYHHILNPKTGYPYENNLTAVTILSEQSVDGDGLSTTCFSLGLEKGKKLIESLDNTYAVFITKDGQLHYTKGFEQFLAENENK